MRTEVDCTVLTNFLFRLFLLFAFCLLFALRGTFASLEYLRRYGKSIRFAEGSAEEGGSGVRVCVNEWVGECRGEGMSGLGVIMDCGDGCEDSGDVLPEI